MVAAAVAKQGALAGLPANDRAYVEGLLRGEYSWGDGEGGGDDQASAAR
jgi:hypothetical protein